MYNKKIFISNFIWRFLERTGAQLVTFVVSIILARLIDPEVFGTIALVTVFTSILQVFVDSGLGNALVQKKDADEIDFSTVFFFNIFMCVLIYILLYLFAPSIANFYDKPELTSIVRVLSLSIIISGVKNIQQAYVTRNLLFKRFFYSTLIGTICAAIVGVWMAFCGYGVWAIVIQGLVNNLVDTLVLWITVKWRPILKFSFERWKSLFSYGWKLLVSALLDTGYGQLRQLLIGKIYTSSDLAFYNRGNTFPNAVITNINASIDSILFPTMSKEQDDGERVKAITRRAIKTSTFLIMPAMVGLAVCAEPIVSIILTDKWLPCVPFLRIFCFTYAFYPIHTANLNAIKAMGRSDYFLKLEIIKKIVGLIVLFSTIWISVMAMAYSLLFTSVISQIINSWPNKKLLGYSYIDQLKDMLPQIGASLLMGTIVYSVCLLNLGDMVTLIIQIPLGILIYILESKIFKIDSYIYTKNMIKNLFGKA